METPGLVGLGELLFDTSGTATSLAQVVQFCLSDIAASFYLDSTDHWTVSLERSFHADTVGDLSYGKG